MKKTYIEPIVEEVTSCLYATICVGTTDELKKYKLLDDQQKDIKNGNADEEEIRSKSWGVTAWDSEW